LAGGQESDLTTHPKDNDSPKSGADSKSENMSPGDENDDLKRQDSYFNELLNKYRTKSERESVEKKCPLMVRPVAEKIPPRRLSGDSSMQLEPDSILTDVRSIGSARHYGSSINSLRLSTDLKQREHNYVIKLLEQANKDNEDEIIEELDIDRNSLKTALLMPPEQFIQQNPGEITLNIYEKYGPNEDLYGLFLIIKKSIALFDYLWDENGILWTEDHLFPLLNELIKQQWFR